MRGVLILYIYKACELPLAAARYEHCGARLENKRKWRCGGGGGEKFISRRRIQNTTNLGNKSEICTPQFVCYSDKPPLLG